MSRLVLAAGGVVGRDGPSGTEIVVVHRGRYDDWSLPKGKLSKGEHPLAAAVREVHEETGVRGVPRLRLPSTRYLTGAPDVEKTVDYWAMRPSAQDPFTPNEEVDEVRWVRLAEAPALLTYGHDRGVLSAYADLPRITGVVVLVRHAYAGERADWPAPDVVRPLDGDGHATADALAEVLALFDPARVVSATPVRCVQTVQPLAGTLGLPVERDDRYDESADPSTAAVALRDLAEAVPAAVVCSQGKAIPPILAGMNGRRAQVYATPKGSGWVLAFSGRDLVGTAHLDRPQ